MGTERLSVRRRIIPKTLIVAKLLAHTETIICLLRNPIFRYHLQMSGSLRNIGCLHPVACVRSDDGFCIRLRNVTIVTIRCQLSNPS
jgi:hypothetical protein